LTLCEFPGNRREGGCSGAGTNDREKQIRNLVISVLERSDSLLEITATNDTPLYLFEPAVIHERSIAFTRAFSSHLEEFEAFFALKCNNHPHVAREAVAAGLGLDVSSGAELQLALETGCRHILFSGPGKTDAELDLAAANAARVTVLMDSFGEMNRLETAAVKAGATVTAGVRLTTRDDGLWRRFGIPLSSLEEFLALSAGKRSVQVSGLQFHASWNLTPEAQVDFIGRLGATLGAMDPVLYRCIRFLDIGGGYWPEEGEWLLVEEGLSLCGTTGLPQRKHLSAAPIGDFAREIARALDKHIFTLISPKVYGEPGRWIADKAMHIMISVADKKADDLVIANAGTNILGWERYETDYVPVINISRPSLDEKACLITGSLCTPHDVWGWSYFGEGIEPGDILILPNQGAYTWSLRQRFIKPEAQVVSLGV
jgi:diaminopimelate decarboxylase